MSVLERPPQRYGQSFIRGGHLRVLVCASVLRSLLPAAPRASPVAPALAPARGMIGRVLYAVAFFLYLISAATAGGITTVQTVSAAAKTLPTTPTRER